MEQHPVGNSRGRVSSRGWIALGIMLLAVALSRIDTPSPKVLVSPLREQPGDSDINMKVLQVFKEKGLDYPVYEKLHMSGQMKHQYPPTVFVLYWPLAGLSSVDYSRFLDVIFRICFLLSAFFTIAIFEQVWKELSPGKLSPWRSNWDAVIGRVSVFVIITFFYPFQIALEQLQVQTFINAAFCLLIWLELRQPQGYVSGLLMGVAASLKPQYGLYFLWGLMRRKIRFAITLFTVVAVVGIITIAMFGMGNVTTFFFRVLPDLSKRGEAYYPNQSVNGILNRLTTTGMNADYSFTAYPPEQPLVAWGTRIGLLAFVGFALLTRKGPKNDVVARALDVSLVGLAFTMGGTIAWEHYYGILAPILGVLVPVILLREKKRAWRLALLVLAYLLTGLRWWQTVVFADHGVLTLLQASTFFGSLIFLALLYLERRDYNLYDEHA